MAATQKPRAGGPSLDAALRQGRLQGCEASRMRSRLSARSRKEEASLPAMVVRSLGSSHKHPIVLIGMAILSRRRPTHP